MAATSKPDAPTTRVLGVSVETWLQLVQRLGISTIILIFIGAAAWRYLPPVVDGHLRLLQSTQETLTTIDTTLKSSNKILQESELTQRRFVESATAAHAVGEADHKDIIKRLENLKTTGKE